MDGDIHGAVQEAQGSQDGASVQDAQTETVKTAAVGNGGAAANGGGKDAAADYEAAIKERDEQIAKLQAQIADAAKRCVLSVCPIAIPRCADNRSALRR